MPNNQPTKTSKSNNNNPKTPAKENLRESFSRNNGIKDSYPKKGYTPMQGSNFGTSKDPKGK